MSVSSRTAATKGASTSVSQASLPLSLSLAVIMSEYIAAFLGHRGSEQANSHDLRSKREPASTIPDTGRDRDD